MTTFFTLNEIFIPLWLYVVCNFSIALFYCSFSSEISSAGNKIFTTFEFHWFTCIFSLKSNYYHVPVTPDCSSVSNSKLTLFSCKLIAHSHLYCSVVNYFQYVNNASSLVHSVYSLLMLTFPCKATGSSLLF